jgi:GAF domain-containing protein
MTPAHLVIDDHFDEALERAARAAAVAVDAAAAAIVVLDDVCEHFLAHVGVDSGVEISRAVARALGYVRLVVENGRPLIVIDTHIDRRIRPEFGEALGIRAFVGVPLVVNGSVVGALCIFDRRPGRIALERLPAELVPTIEARLTARRLDVDSDLSSALQLRPALRLLQAMQAGAMPVEVFLRALRLLPAVTIPSKLP